MTDVRMRRKQLFVRWQIDVITDDKSRKREECLFQTNQEQVESREIYSGAAPLSLLLASVKS